VILILRTQLTEEERNLVLAQVSSISGQQRSLVKIEGRSVLALDATRIDRETRSHLAGLPGVERVVAIPTAYKLGSRLFKDAPTAVVVGNDHVCDAVMIGRTQPAIIAGPCAVESREQLFEVAAEVKAAGAHILRGGAFKPRTSPYQFQGLGVEGLAFLAEARERTGLPVVTEVMEVDLVETVARYADMLQIGARNMQNYPLLQACGRHSQKRPILLKRGLSATIEEWLLAAEYIMASGNPNVVLCERGIRSYDQYTRNVLDLTAVPLLRELTHLPIIVDPSHSTGKSSLVPPMARASIAVGADGLIVEVHTHPDQALCDGKQAITPQQLSNISRESRAIAALSRTASTESTSETESKSIVA